MKKLIVIFVLGFVFVIIVSAFFLFSREFDYSPQNTDDYRPKMTVGLFLGKMFEDVEVVSTREKMSLGLGGRETLEEDAGMLFVFSEPDFYGIWMKDMLFSIDIIWLDENFKVVHIEENVPPDSYPEVFSPNEKAKYVFEVVAGTVENSGIFVGQEGEIF